MPPILDTDFDDYFPPDVLTWTMMAMQEGA
jgi:hypothetical protein